MPRRQRHWTYHEEKVRKAVLIRDNYECQIRGPNCELTATTVDHIHPKAWGGLAVPSNLRAACKTCNYSKGARATGVERRDDAPSLAAKFFSGRHTSRWDPLESTCRHASLSIL